MSVLDDLKMIHARDAQDALGVAEKQWQQLQHEFQLPAMSFPVENIVFAGMGGSALAATLSISWPGYKLPFEVCRDYRIPAYVSNKTLFIASSYSGNTEETVEALSTAEEKGAHIVVIASGGKLADIAKEKGYPLELLPTGFQPRMAVLYSFRALVTVLERAGLVAITSVERELHEAGAFMADSVALYRPDVPTDKNPAKQLALELMGNSIVVYSGPLLFPVAYKWKINFNENAKTIAWCNQLPEFNHNEFLGWTSHPIDKPYKIVDIRSSLEHPQIQKRFEISERLLSGKRPAAEVVTAQGDTLLKQLLWTIQLGDFVSLYLALLNGLNPSPVVLIEKLKDALGHSAE